MWPISHSIRRGQTVWIGLWKSFEKCTLYFYPRTKLFSHTLQTFLNAAAAVLHDLDQWVTIENEQKKKDRKTRICSRLKPTLSCWILMSWLSAIARKLFRFSSSSRMYTGTPRKEVSTTSLNMSTSVNVSITMETTCVEKVKLSLVTAKHQHRGSLCLVIKTCWLNQEGTFYLKVPVRPFLRRSTKSLFYFQGTIRWASWQNGATRWQITRKETLV